MTDQDCIAFLQWSLPKLRMRWLGFRKVRRQVCKRIDARIRELQLAAVPAYRSYLETHPDEWQLLDSFCRVTISHFYRDRDVFQLLERDVLPELAAALSRGCKELRCWSIGCASGEEPYTLALLWDLALSHQYPSLELSIVATDSDSVVIERAKEGCYSRGSIKNLSLDWIDRGFVREGKTYCIRDEYRKRIKFLEQDIRTSEPDGVFDLILCRNLVFTYFDETMQRDILERLRNKMVPGGALVIGNHESPPQDQSRFLQSKESHSVFRCNKT